MSNVHATVTDLRIEDQNLAFTISVDGDPGGTAVARLSIYDADGGEHERRELGNLVVGQQWEGHALLPVWTLEDGDYGAWITVDTTTASREAGRTAEEGIGFLIGRHRAYPTTEAADKQQSDSPPELSPLRLEGTWVVFDMKNKEAFDVEVHHRFTINLTDSDQYVLDGEELVRAGATQQGHYLLPESLSDGRHQMMVEANVQGSFYAVPAMATVHVDGEVLTLLPA